MNLKKYRVLNQQNIHKVARALQDMGRHTFTQTYPNGKRQRRIAKLQGLSDSKMALATVKCQPIQYRPHYQSKIEVDTMGGRTFIRVTYDQQNGGLIYVGARFRLTTNRLYVRDTMDRCWPHEPNEGWPLQVYAKS